MQVTELIAGSTGQLKYTPKVNGAAITAALPSFTVVLTDEDGTAVTLAESPTYSAGAYYQTITPAEATTALMWQQMTVEYTWVDSEGRTLKDSEWVIIIDRPSDYGTVVGVQQFYLTLITFSATSDPITAKQVQDIIISNSARVNMKLAAAGYTTPVTGAYPAAVKIVDDIVEHYVAAEVYRRFNAMQEARGGALSQADAWKADADDMLMTITSGAYSLSDVPKSGSDAGSSAGASNSREYAGISSASTNAFIEAHRPPNGGYN